ncbi:MAG: hypothetical protein ACON4T_02090 [Synechococcus sp.]
MNAQWNRNKKLKPDILLSKIDNMKTIAEEEGRKRVSYSRPGDFLNALAALVNMVDFPRHCDGLNHQIIVTEAVHTIAKDHKLEKDKIMEEINKIVTAELATTEHKYHLLTSISLAPPYPIEEITIENSKVRILTGAYPGKYQGRSGVSNSYSHIARTPANYAKVIVSLKNKSARGAASKSLRALDILRSILCLFGNSSIEIIGDEWKPINKVRLGSLHTIHEDMGNIIDDIFWSEPNFSSATLFKPKAISAYTKNCQWALSKLKEIQYNTHLKDALLRYVRALDEKDQNTAFIRLWGALEAATAPSKANSDLVIRRCAFLFQERDYHMQILEHLREYRNSNVHSGDESENAKFYCYQLQHYFHSLILFHLSSQGEFSTLDEANSFLDLPAQKEALQKKKHLIEKAINFIQ